MKKSNLINRGAHGLMKYNCREIIIDGYNLLHKIYPGAAHASFPQLREGMENILSSYRHKTLLHVTVVYDGGDSQRGACNHGAIHVVFTPGGTTADRWIIDHVAPLKSRAGALTVISSDREIRQYVKAYGADWMSSESFVEELHREACLLDPQTLKAKKKRPVADKKSASRSLSQREVEQWLKLFNPEK